MINCDIKYSEFPLGSVFMCENLNIEFKKFTFNKKSDVIINNKNVLASFFETGEMTSGINKIIMNILKEYIEEYIPKYTVCFFNIDTLLTHSESFFFIGIDDNGVINGIPFNFLIDDDETLCTYINNLIINSIKRSVVNNIVSLDEIISCIDYSLITFNKRTKSFLGEKSSKGQTELNKLKNDVELLEKDIESLDRTKMELNLLVDSITIDSIKNNSSMNKKLLNYVIKSKNFPIIFDSSNIAYTIFLFDTMINFDPKTFSKDYVSIIKEHPEIEYYFESGSDERMRALGTLLHEEIKSITDRIRKKTVVLSNDKKEKVDEMKRIYKITSGKYDKMYYDLDNYFTLINSHEHNSYFLIKVQFNNNKYKNILQKHPLYDSNIKQHISYIDQKGQIVTSQRGYKLKNNKVDPECYQIQTR